MRRLVKERAEGHSQGLQGAHRNIAAPEQAIQGRRHLDGMVVMRLPDHFTHDLGAIEQRQSYCLGRSVHRQQHGYPPKTCRRKLTSKRS